MNPTFADAMDNAQVLIAICPNPKGGTKTSLAVAPGISFKTSTLAQILRNYADKVEAAQETLSGEDV